MRSSLLLLLAVMGCADPDGKGPRKDGTTSGTPGSGATTTSAGTPVGTPVDPLPARTCDLLANPGAEDGTTGWTVDLGELAAVGASGSTPVPWEGSQQFSMGQAERSRASQVVDLEPWALAVEGGDVVAHLDAQVRNWSGNDEVWIGLAALDADGQVLDDQQAGPFTSEAWRLERVHLALPADAVSLAVSIGGVRVQGTDNDAYLDALSLCLDRDTPPDMEPPSLGPWLSWVTTDGVSVLWESSTDYAGGVELGPADGDWEDVVLEGAAGRHHEVRLDGLLPDTVYRYRLRNGDDVGETWSFRTAPTASVPFRFTVWGDNQDGPDIFAEVVDRMEQLDPDFALSVGDVVQTGSEANWRNQLLDPLADLTLDTSVLVAAGNHERYGDGNASLFDLHLAQPGDEHCFTWNYGGAAFLFIDTENAVDSGPQATCIADALASPDYAGADVQIALFHYPPRIEYWAFWTFDGIPLYTGDPEVRDVLEPQFEAAGVDLVFNGHNHLYAYTPAGTYSTVAWVTTGGGGGSIDTSGWVVGNWDGIAETLFDHHFLEVSVDGRQIDVRAVGVDGSELHSFTVVGD